MATPAVDSLRCGQERLEIAQLERSPADGPATFSHRCHLGCFQMTTKEILCSFEVGSPVGWYGRLDRLPNGGRRTEHVGGRHVPAPCDRVATSQLEHLHDAEPVPQGDGERSGLGEDAFHFFDVSLVLRQRREVQESPEQ
jgi:hypothetical protein